MKLWKMVLTHALIHVFLDAPPPPLNLPELRHVSYLQEKYFHFGFTFSFVLMLNEMYSLVQITRGIIVCRELCLLRHNTLPNRYTTSWLFMTNRFLRSLKHLFQGTLPNCPVFLSRQFNGHVDLWTLCILGLNSANTYFFLVSIMSCCVFTC